jgi:homoserine kinase
MTEVTSVTIHAPATIANVGCAFDAIGFAIDGIGDTVTASTTSDSGVVIQSITGDSTKLSKDIDKNTASVAITAMLRDYKKSIPGITLDIHKGLPVGSGLGSSSASAVAGVVAVNELLGCPFTRRELIPYAMEGERIACGAAHADNVAPALLGGFVLIRSCSPLEIIELPSPSELYITVTTPAIELRTSDARKVLRDTVQLKTATQQWANVAGLVAGLFRNELSLIGRSIKDVVIEPSRSKLIPGFYDIQQAALASGALGCTISGSGPSLFALSSSKEIANTVGQAMVTAWRAHNIPAQHLVTRVNEGGATQIAQPCTFVKGDSAVA